MRNIFRLAIALLLWAGLHSAASAVGADRRRSEHADDACRRRQRRAVRVADFVRPAGLRDAARDFPAAGMYVMVHSAKYHNAPMPHSIFFYGQYAIHGTEAVGISAMSPRTAVSASRRKTPRRCSRWSAARARGLRSKARPGQLRYRFGPSFPPRRRCRRLRGASTSRGNCARLRPAATRADAEAVGRRPARPLTFRRNCAAGRRIRATYRRYGPPCWREIASRVLPRTSLSGRSPPESLELAACLRRPLCNDVNSWPERPV